jgi:hypothetical protein
VIRVLLRVMVHYFPLGLVTGLWCSASARWIISIYLTIFLYLRFIYWILYLMGGKIDCIYQHNFSLPPLCNLTYKRISVHPSVTSLGHWLPLFHELEQHLAKCKESGDRVEIHSGLTKMILLYLGKTNPE